MDKTSAGLSKLRNTAALQRKQVEERVHTYPYTLTHKPSLQLFGSGADYLRMQKKGKNAHLERHFCSDPKNKPTGWLQKRRKHGTGESVVKWANSISTTSAFILLAGCRKWNVLNLRPFLGTHAGTMVKLIHEVPSRTFLGVQECSQWLTNRP